jgi:hypothetical protein
MRRREIADSELRQIIKHKKSGVSWLKIQEKTGIPRRSAKRAYEDWERDQSKQELKAARIQVATEAFREHVEHILEVAEALVDELPQWMIFYEKKNAEEALNHVFMRDIPGEPEAIVRFQQRNEREQRRIFRQNQMLFQALIEHTCEEVQWQVLEEWKQAWNACQSALQELHREAADTVMSILNNQKPDVEREIGLVGAKKIISKEMVDGVVEALWRGSRESKLEKADNLIRTKAEKKGTTLVVFGDSGSVTVVELAEANLAEEVAKICKWAAKNLYIKEKEGLLQQFKNSTDSMKKAAEKLDEQLNPLLLRPMILRTHCHLCPVG